MLLLIANGNMCSCIETYRVCHGTCVPAYTEEYLVCTPVVLAFIVMYLLVRSLVPVSSRTLVWKFDAHEWPHVHDSACVPYFSVKAGLAVMTTSVVQAFMS